MGLIKEVPSTSVFCPSSLSLSSGNILLITLSCLCILKIQIMPLIIHYMTVNWSYCNYITSHAHTVYLREAESAEYKMRLSNSNWFKSQNLDCKAIHATKHKAQTKHSAVTRITGVASIGPKFVCEGEEAQGGVDTEESRAWYTFFRMF